MTQTNIYIKHRHALFCFFQEIGKVAWG